MDYVYLAVIGSLFGTSTIVFIYLCLYILYRDRCIGIWAISWIPLLSKHIFFDSGLLTWKQSTLSIIIYELLIIFSALTFVWGIHIFKNKILSKMWKYSFWIVSIASITITSLSSSLLYQLFLPLVFSSFICLWAGYTFLKLTGVGRLITGYAFILWTILNIILPFTINYTWFTPWAYSLGGILRLLIAVGLVIVYFEKIRTALASTETQYRLLAENAVDIIYYYKLFPNPVIKYISPSVLTVTGYTAEEFYANNKLTFKLIHPDDSSIFATFLRRLPNSVQLPLTLRLVKKDGTSLWIEQKYHPLYDNTGKLIGIEGIIRDITDRKNLEQMASLVDRMTMIGNMAATVAHEIRNPLTTVRGYLQILERRQEYQKDKDKFDLAIDEIDRANSIIREYLALSREKLVNLHSCSLNNIVEALFPLIQADAASTKVLVSLELNPLPPLLLDENEIRQLLLNLVRNGIEAMTAGGSLIIQTALENTNVILSIKDQGSGIPAQVLKKIGTPFLTTKVTGTGLGLPICYQIAHRHNASIKIATSPQGTTFLIYFTIPS